MTTENLQQTIVRNPWSTSFNFMMRNPEAFDRKTRLENLGPIGMPLEEAHSEFIKTYRQRVGKRSDVAVNLRRLVDQMHFTNPRTDRKSMLAAFPQDSWKEHPKMADTLLFEERAVRQLCSYIKVPYNFVKKLTPQTATAAMRESVALLNLNDQKRHTLRVSHSDRGTYSSPAQSQIDRANANLPVVRGIVGHKYIDFDMPEWFNAISDALGGKGYRAIKGHVGSSYYIYIALGDCKRGPDGYSTVPALKLYNGELGNRACGFDLGLLRPRCMNGMISFASEYRYHQRHSGVGDFANMLRDNIQRCEEAAQRLQRIAHEEGKRKITRGEVEAMLSKVPSLSTKERYTAARIAAGYREERVQGSTNYTERQVVGGLTVEQASNSAYEALDEFIAWDVMNAITQIARDTPSVTRQAKLEEEATKALLYSSTQIA